MYGEMPLEDILPEVKKAGCVGIDIWCKVHGNQREQIDAMGHEKALALFQKHEVKPTVFTRYPLGPFGLREEMPVARRFGAEMVLCGTTGPSEPQGEEAKAAVKAFLEKMKPHVAAAEEAGLTIAVENHDRQLLYHPDSLRYFAEFNRSPHLGIALAFHHLHAFVPEIPKLIRDLGNAQIPFIYFQEHSEGIRKKVPKEIEMQQMPGFGGGLDYRPIVRALRAIDYKGYGEIFMHPVPRGIPILPTVPEITGAINRSRTYLQQCLDATAALEDK
jgi:sugar phosphate isomerase/epimerase